jgi:hypothetical protein
MLQLDGNVDVYRFLIFYRARSATLNIWIYTYATSQCLCNAFANECVDFYITLDRFNDAINCEIVHCGKLDGSGGKNGKGTLAPHYKIQPWYLHGNIKKATEILSGWSIFHLRFERSHLLIFFRGLLFCCVRTLNWFRYWIKQIPQTDN